MINWGFLGAGYIASQALAPAVNAASNSKLYAVASRDLAKAQRLSATKSYTSYQELIDDPLVDVVYINLPNHLHAKWSIAALNAGKNVLCEKPFAMDITQANAMADAAKESGKLLVEAVWARWHPRFIRAVEIVKSGQIGQLTSIESEFSFMAKLAGDYRNEVGMGGGANLDVGTYQIHLWSALVDLTNNVEITSVKKNLAASGVDLTTVVEAKIGESLLVKATSSFEREGRQEITIKGEKGEIAFSVGEAFTNWHKPSELSITSDGKSRTEVFESVDPYQLMVESVSAQVGGLSAWLVPIPESLLVMSLLDQIRLKI
jgi:D-xylose 1-dehydrogenase (NADP+, D-xylono-1,5-lactone-forming)